MKLQSFQSTTITESIVAFAQFVRSHGLNIGIQETNDALKVADLGLFLERKPFKNALRAIFCNSPEEMLLYNGLFNLYWDTNPVDLRENKDSRTIKGQMLKKNQATLVMLGQGKSENDEAEEAKNVSGSKINDIDAKILEEIAQKLFNEMALRLRRRMKESQSEGQLNLRRTIRRSLSFGGEPIELYRKAKKPKKQRLIVLLDVSGSMDKYSFYLLRFVCALSENFRQIEAFIFSTSLIRITNSLKAKRLDFVLEQIENQANNWSSGTKIGESFETFYDKFGKRTLNGSPIVIILSDGLDTGQPELLEAQMRKIQQKVRKIVWLNPLKGMVGYQPTARGMAAALPSVKDFRSGHNINSLLELENILHHA
jgi:uncharacterized protein